MASPSSSAGVQSRTKFAKLGYVEWPTYQVPEVVLGKVNLHDTYSAAYQVAGSRYQSPPQRPSVSRNRLDIRVGIKINLISVMGSKLTWLLRAGSKLTWPYRRDRT